MTVKSTATGLSQLARDLILVSKNLSCAHCKSCIAVLPLPKGINLSKQSVLS